MRTVSLLLLAGLAVALQSGCGESRAASVAADEPAAACTFKAGHGLRLTEQARAFAGIATGEALPRRMGAADVLAVPREAVVRTVRGDFAYVENGGWLLRTPVTVGAADLTHLEIRDGLYEGDVVVVRGVRALVLAEIQAVNGGVGCADGH